MLCVSVLIVDQQEIKLACVEGEYVTRDIQVWNRSECELVYGVEVEGLVGVHASLSSVDYDTGQVLGDRHIKVCVAPFASQRIGLTFSAEVRVV